MSRPRIEVPSAAGDRPSLAPLVAIAVLGLGAGFALVHGTLVDAPAGAAAPDESSEGRGRGPAASTNPGEREGQDEQADPPADDQAPGATAGGAVPSQDPAQDPSQDPSLDPSLDPSQDPSLDEASELEAEERIALAGDPARETPGGPTEDPAPPPHRMVPGRVAYLRCEGAQPTDGPFPCPRDRDLERVVWGALGALAECPGRPLAGGEGDLRLTFSGGILEERAVRSGGDPALPEAQVLACLEEALGAVTTAIRAPDLVVAFRFELQRR